MRENSLRPKVIIYDCDGVLIDARKANETYYSQILSHFHQPPLQEEHHQAIQILTAAEIIPLIFRDKDLIEDALAYERSLDNTSFLPLIRLESNIVEALTRLRQKYRTAVATNRGKSLRPILTHHGLTEMFDFIVSSHDVLQPKPHPECLAKILQHFCLKPTEAVYVGDSEIDRSLCARTGVPFIAYRNRSLIADYHIENHLELVDLLSPPPRP